jgi:hypothetical protein
MAETVLFDLFGVIAHHQSPERRNRLRDGGPRDLLPHRPRQAEPGRFPLVPRRARRSRQSGRVRRRPRGNIQAAQTIGIRCHLFTTPARVREFLAVGTE